MNARRYHFRRRLVDFACMLWALLSVYTVGAQTVAPFQQRIYPLKNEVAYTVQFVPEYRTVDADHKGKPASDVSSSVTKVRLVLRDFKVEGPDSAVTALISLRLELPEQLPGETIFLNALMPDGATPTFLHRWEEPVRAEGTVTVSYAGREVSTSSIDLSYKFPLPKDSGTVVAAPVTDEVVPPAEREPEVMPAFEVDYRRLPPEAFIDKWPGQTPLVNRALARIPLRPEVEEVATRVYELRFRNVRAVRLDSVAGGLPYVIRANEAVIPYGHRMVVEALDTAVYRLHVSDSTKLQDATVVTLDNLLAGTFHQTPDSAAFTFSGGHPPYMLLFLRDGIPVADYDVGNDTAWHVLLDDLRNIIGAAGTYGMQFTDSQRSVTWNFSGAELSLDRQKKPVQDYRIPLLVAAALLLIVFVYGARNLLRRRKGRLIRQSLQQVPATPAEAATGHRPAIESSVYPSRSRTARPPATVPKGFRVTKRDVRDRFNGRFNPDDQPEQFLSIDLAESWTISSVSRLLFAKQAVRSLNEFLRRENIDKISAPAADGGPAWERNKDIPEIGGMLMGQYKLEPATTTYRVSVEQFIPLAARVQNLVKMEIDPLSLARDLSQAQDDYPHLTVVGWFHTHPGHGLFLSQPDLKVQYSHFRKPYHFAMEIDSLTDQLDTAFFTYMPDGRMNNQHSRRDDRSWFSWIEMEKVSRQQTNTLP